LFQQLCGFSASPLEICGAARDDSVALILGNLSYSAEMLYAQTIVVRRCDLDCLLARQFCRRR